MSEDYEQTYETYWKEIVEEDGKINLDQVKRELHDALTLSNSISKVYCHITGGLVSKPFTCPDTVCNLADEHYEELLQEDKALDEKEAVEAYKQKLRDWVSLFDYEEFIDSSIFRELLDFINQEEK